MFNNIKDESILYLINIGKDKGKTCRILQYLFKNMKAEEAVALIAFVDPGSDETETIMAKDLIPIDPPGWPLTEKEYQRRCASVYGLEEWLAKERRTGSNLIRTGRFTQPQALRIGDVLATGETVEKIRRGYDDSVILKLDRSGWVEVPPRLPVALLRNEKSLLPIRLAEKDELVTGCVIFQNSTTIESKSLINVYLDCRDCSNCSVEVAACIPLALV
jgi:hypothetical protein